MNVLITNHHIENYAGTEINALELCKALRNIGINADVGTFFYGSPMKKIYENHGIDVINLFDDQINLSVYDLFWMHHFPTANQVVFNEKFETAKLIFSSLGSFAPLESPPYYKNRMNFILTNSMGNKEILMNEGVEERKIYYFPNFAPTYYFNENYQPRTNLSRIAIISNHPPKELLQFSERATSSGYEVDIVGLQHQPVYVDNNFLQAYDLIISIGKTVNYCFALGVPVYCYDHFGGPGYIDPENLEISEKYVFSGRGINRKLTGEKLFQEITIKYEPSLNNLDFLSCYASENFNLETNIKELLSHLSKSEPVDVRSLRENYPAVRRQHEVWLSQARQKEHANKLYELLQRKMKINKGLSQDFAETSAKNEKLKNILVNLNQKITDLTANNEELLQKIENQKRLIKLQENEILSYVLNITWRIMRPIRKILRFFNHH